MANGWVDDPSRSARAGPLCESCLTWLASVIADVRSGGSDGGLVGKPTHGARVLMFEDQCSLCHEMPGPTGNLMRCVATVPGHASWPQMFACPSCDIWLAGLADDGRSARGEAGRVIDGPYGEWPHPNLRELSVALAVADKGARTAILEATAAMGVAIVTQPDARTFLFLEAGAGFDSVALLRTDESPSRRVLLAPLAAGVELRSLLANGAMAWLTIPVTPQQVTAALSFAMRQRGLRVRWDLETSLPVASMEGFVRDGLRCTPSGGTDRFELAWLLKRFSRGYDDVVMANGEIVLLPRASANSLDLVVERLDRLLAGRCRFERIQTGEQARRFDVAG